MLTALDNNGFKMYPQRGVYGLCPYCNTVMIPHICTHCIDHFKHKSLEQCDPWHEGETEWHLQWKSLFPKERIEVIISKDGDKHITDAIFRNGRAIEFQHSYIPSHIIAEREIFYGYMCWIFDCREAWRNKRFYITNNWSYGCGFRWKHPRKTISTSECRKVLDIGLKNKVFLLKKLHIEGSMCGGWGKLIDKQKFIDILLNGYLYQINELEHTL